MRTPDTLRCTKRNNRWTCRDGLGALIHLPANFDVIAKQLYDSALTCKRVNQRTVRCQSSHASGVMTVPTADGRPLSIELVVVPSDFDLPGNAEGIYARTSDGTKVPRLTDRGGPDVDGRIMIQTLFPEGEGDLDSDFMAPAYQIFRARLAHEVTHARDPFMYPRARTADSSNKCAYAATRVERRAYFRQIHEEVKFFHARAGYPKVRNVEDAMRLSPTLDAYHECWTAPRHSRELFKAIALALGEAPEPPKAKPWARKVLKKGKKR